ncbi:MAG: bacteriohemerythrin [Deferribacteraceae bacterium]|jgi:methyl-accepting chemotaxis protein/hemerythrin|nr:bacteriohemerythrin [Deferribacteraceae bacterium]
MKNLKISTKLLGVVGIISLVVFGIAFFIMSGSIERAFLSISDSVGSTQAASQLSLLMLAAFISASLVSLLALRFCIGCFVSKPLTALSAMFVQMADGDFSKTVKVRCGDEIGEIEKNLNATLLKLNGLFTTLKGASVEVKSTAHSVGDANEKMADSSYQQAESATVMNNTIEKLDQSIQELSEHVDTTALEAMSAHKTAENGSEMLRLSVEKIHELNDAVLRSSANVDTLAASVEKITNVLGIIDDIAEQTNLLALNAAIEAARAGEAGRGFAVVADEVRKLAENTVRATLEISNMLQTVNKDVKDTISVMQEGIHMSKETEETTTSLFTEIQAIIELVLSISSKVEGMVSVLQRQSDATISTVVQVKAVASSADENNRITQENVSQVEGLKNLANRLEASVASFKLRSTLVEWSQALSVGVMQFDDEHHRLIDLINQLYSAIQDGSSTKVLSDVLEDLLNYTKTHFTGEIAQLEKYKWHDLENHKKLHKFFVDKIIKAQEDLRSGAAMLGPDIIKFLNDWLIGHIQKIDAQYTEFFHSNGIK